MVAPAVIGGAQIALGVGQAISGYNAQKQDYLNQTAFQDAQNEFANWQAGFNSKIQDANKQYQYWSETVQYNQNLAYTNSLRNVELTKAIRQAEVIEQTRAAAGASYIQDSEAINDAYQQASMQEAVATQQYRWRSLQARASVQAMERQGKSIDRIINDYSRQQGDYETLQAINAASRTRQFTRQQAAQVSQYLSRYNSQQFYEEQPFIEPLAPFAPLPTLVTPAGPTMRGGGPSKTAALLNVGSAVLGGIDTGIKTASRLKALKKPNSPTGPGT
tara:strand:+ start:1004 stop:1828 length:825 start_codon:yes stop_codon:yes gene_type:complete